MARLSDLVNVNINRNTIIIQGQEIPVIFTFKSFPYVEEAYGKPYEVFEKDINRLVKKGQFTLGKKEIKLMNSLIYAMVKSGGTECTPYELENAIPINDLPAIFEKAFDLFQGQNFQIEDQNKLKSEKKS
ncbi:hypothetical protein BME96_12470 [Virgibacillus halodenitrificans]|uniref:Phage protein n=1 Tax=Virgibacillus halodenitrificans TaxID=1482 RepID=A0AAC9NLS8_VIRHA|nr:hypothetical protein [Virgibacillus halodenitrificans]APC48956.1 hypothetical protein BME96_12470 [Virgibacillus halodenitrificans]